MWNSLRVRLTAILLGLAIGPLLLTGVILYQRTFASEKKQALAFQNQVAQNVAAEVDSLFQSVVHDLTSLGNSIQNLNSPDRAQQLSLMLGTLSSSTYQDAYEELILLDSQGREVVRLSRQEIVPASQLASRSNLDEFNQPKSNRETYYGPIQFDKNSGQAFILIAIPLYKSRSVQLNNVLIAKLRFGIVSNLIGRSAVDANQTLYVTDMNGNVVAHKNRSVKLQDAHIILPANASFQSGLDGTNVALAFQAIQLGQQTFKVVAEKPASQALALANTTITTLGLIIVATLITAIILGFLSVQQIVQPIEKLVVIAQSVASGDLTRQVSITRKDEIGILASTFNSMTSQLRNLIGTLEQRVAERTTDLELSRQQSIKRANELQSISEISKIITSEKKLEELLPLITRLVSERFGFYHTGIFLIDSTNQFAVLQAANSTGGKNMLMREHKLEVGGSGIVGYVAQFGIPRISLDVGQDAVYFDNPDLPNTRSEMALPLKARDRVMGVLDVQSERPGAFTENDTNTLSILADQIAISLENAQLFTQTQHALSEAQALYRQNLQEGWRTFSREKEFVGYQQSLTSGKKLTELVETDEIRQAMNRGEVLIFHADGITEEASIIVPIKLRGQIIGTMKIKAPAKNRQWSTDEVNLAETISERLSIALENARLIQESQRQVIKEQTISEVTGKIGASINLKNVLQTAVEELGRALPGSDVVIRFEQKNGSAE